MIRRGHFARLLAAGATVAGVIATATPASAATGSTFTTFANPLTGASDFITGWPSSCSLGPMGVLFDGTRFLASSPFCDGKTYDLGPGGGDISSAPSVQNGFFGLGRRGSTYYAANGGSLAQFDPTTLQPVSTSTVNTGCGLYGVAPDPLSTDVYVSSCDGIYVIHNPGASATSARITTDGGDYDGLYFTPDGQDLWAAEPSASSIVEFDRKGTVMRSVPIGAHGPDGIAVTRSDLGNGLANNIFVNDNDGTILRVDPNNDYAVTVVASGGSRGDFATVGPDGCLYVTQTDRVEKISPCIFAAQAVPTAMSTTAALLTLTPIKAYLLTLQATLTAAGSPVAGQKVSFVAKGDTICTATTTAAGLAKCDLLVPLSATGILSVIQQSGYTATFAGSGQYLASRATSTLIKNSPPVITGLSPAAGPTTGRTTVTITGAGFTGAKSVSFGGAAATNFSVVSDGKITAVAPARATPGQVAVSVTSPAGTSPPTSGDIYHYAPVPAVTSLSPVSGPTGGGTSVTITGTGFTSASSVMFGSVEATNFSVVSDTTITATSPASSSAADVDVSVTTPGGTTPKNSADVFRYLAAPVVSSLSPTSGSTKGGTTVVITGSGFTGATAVTFGTTTNAASFTVNSDTQITAVSPAHSAGTFLVFVTTPSGTSGFVVGAGFTFVMPPAVTAISPTSGPTAGGTTVVITGAGFTGATAVSFGTTAATSFTVDSDTQITAVAPAHSAAIANVSVTTGYGKSATTTADQFTFVKPPAVTAISPTSGPTAGGTTVVITGTGFTGATAVSFGTTAATSFTVDSDTQITAVSPAHGAAVVNVFVTTAYGKSATVAADKFTYSG
ncbi:MAG TPA: IPT/TIG domain-containing protein [Mycobacteriales bacterium]|nr:IPT/TIG domain-containing protein [Mycobacteriales bacterium]